MADAVGIPLLHLADVIAAECQAKGLESVGLPGHDVRDVSLPFFTDRIAFRTASTCWSPTSATTRPSTGSSTTSWSTARWSTALVERTVVGLIDELWDAGAGGVILGCTELELLVKQADADIPVLPGSTLHVAAALDRALS